MIGKSFRKFIISPNSLRMKYYKLYNRLYFRYKGICFGENMQVYNKVYITGGVKNVHIGKNFHFTSGDGVNPICRNLRGCIHTESVSSQIVIGDNVGMSSACIRIREKLIIGNNVDLGGNCVIYDTDAHPLNYLARRGEIAANPDDPQTCVQSAPVTIEDDVWIGANCIILKGVTIGARSVIGAGSVVTKSIPADCIAAGNPCRVIRKMEL